MLSTERITLLACTAAAIIGVGLIAVLFSMTMPGSWIANDRDQAGTTTTIGKLPGRLPADPIALAKLPHPHDEPSTTRERWKPSVLPMPPVSPESETGPWSTNVEPTTPPTPPGVKKPSVSPRVSRPPSKTRRLKKRRGRRYTLKSRLAEIEPAAKQRLIAKFKSAEAPWPPAEVALIAIKDEKNVELHARSAEGVWQHIHSYRVLAASGGAGPKLRRGDRQVPEGVYRIVYLNPNSAFHVSLRVNYPRSFDRKMAKKDGRKDLGGDIMIHGKKSSAGCLAMGDPAAEELFVLAALVGKRKVKLVIAPTDFRSKGVSVKGKQPRWVPKLYTEIATAMADYKKPPPPPNTGLLSLIFNP